MRRRSLRRLLLCSHEAIVAPTWLRRQLRRPVGATIASCERHIFPGRKKSHLTRWPGSMSGEDCSSSGRYSALVERKPRVQQYISNWRVHVNFDCVFCLFLFILQQSTFVRFDNKCRPKLLHVGHGIYAIYLYFYVKR